jgi:hypothetical protein
MPKAIKRGRVAPGHQGEGTELTLKQEATMINWIEEQSARNEHGGRMDILHYVGDKYNPAPTKGWVNYFFLRR